MADNVWLNPEPNFSGQAGEDIDAGEAVCIAADDGLVYLADANDGDRRPCIGFAEVSVEEDEYLTVLGHGQICGATGLTPGATLYLSTTAGAVTQTAPAAYQQAVGVATCATEFVIRLEPREAYGT